MSDPNKFINAYINTAIQTIHESATQNLKLKTDLAVLNEVLAEKEQQIASLTSRTEELEKSVSDESANSSELTKITNSYTEINERLRQENEAFRKKVEHMNSVLTQLVEMKKMLQERDAELQKLKSPKKTRAKKKVINTDNESNLELVDDF